MLRITNTTTEQTLTLRLEGRLEGPWVAVLAQCWSTALPTSRGRRLCVDLNGVTFVDAQGKGRLAEMYAQGAELLGEDVEMKAIVAEIRTGRAGDGHGESLQVTSCNAGVNVSNRPAHLQRLEAELHAVNQELAQAARPLERLSELNGEQREQVADKIRAGLARWESVTQQISQAMGIGNADDQAAPKGNESGSR
jgi:hypothetical protein